MRRWLALGGLVVLATFGLTYWTSRAKRDERARHESHALTEAVRRVAKLATVETSVSNWQTLRDARDLLGFIPIRCEKTLAVFYRGKVAAGFDGLEGIALQITDGRAQLTLPAPQVLYMDVPPPEVLVADGSVCNKIRPEDYQRLHAEAREAIQREALAGGILRRAEDHARQLLVEVLRPLGYSLEVTVGSPPLSAR